MGNGIIFDVFENGFELVVNRFVLFVNVYLFSIYLYVGICLKGVFFYVFFEFCMGI